MLDKEWWEARWKFVLAAVVFLVVAVLAPRSFDKIKADIQQEIKWAQNEELNGYEIYSGEFSEMSLDGAPPPERYPRRSVAGSSERTSDLSKG